MGSYYLYNDKGEISGHVFAPDPLSDSGWLPLCKQWPDLRGKTVVTHCCVRRIPTRDCKLRVLGYEWFDPTQKIECKDDRGCKINPRLKNGADLRGWSAFGDDGWGVSIK